MPVDHTPATHRTTFCEYSARIWKFCCDDTATTSVEYLFMLSLVIFAAMIGIGLVGGQTKALFDRTKNALP